MGNMLPELYTEEVDLPFDPAVVAADGVQPWDDMGTADLQLRDVRNMLVRLRQLEAEAAQVAKVRKEVAAAYQQREQVLEVQVIALRGALQAVLERGPFGPKLDFPDAGKLHLTSTGGNLKLVNQEQAVSTYGYRFPLTGCDVQAMNTWAREHHKATGEVPDGYEVQARGKSLVVRQA